jgi:hypothetical protein
MQVSVSNVVVILRHMLQIFYLNVAYVVDTHLSQAYVPNVLSILEVCYSKFMFHEAHRRSAWGGRAPGGAAGRADAGEQQGADEQQQGAGKQ